MTVFMTRAGGIPHAAGRRAPDRVAPAPAVGGCRARCRGAPALESRPAPEPATARARRRERRALLSSPHEEDGDALLEEHLNDLPQREEVLAQAPGRDGRGRLR